jgi:hypothetical protein
MPRIRDGRPLKRWRYVGVYGPELSLCVGDVRIGPGRQRFWALWDPAAGRLRERTRFARLWRVRVEEHAVRVADDGVLIDLALGEGEGVEIVSAHGASYIWTRKQAGVAVRGRVVVDGAERAIEGRALIDDSAGYHARHTAWRWCAGLGSATDGRALAWNLVAGVHDAPTGSERTVWVDGEPAEVGPVDFAPDLSGVGFAEGGGLAFHPEAVRRRRDDLLLVRSSYEQPFGSFTGSLPGGVELAQGHGVMERHEAWW